MKKILMALLIGAAIYTVSMYNVHVSITKNAAVACEEPPCRE